MSAHKKPKLSKEAAKAVADSFTREGERSSPRCKMCSKVLMVDTHSNLKRHLSLSHKDMFAEMITAVDENVRPERKIPAISVPIDQQLLIEYSVKMVTIGGLAFNMLDQPGLSDLMRMLTNALKMPQINRKTIPAEVDAVAKAFKAEIYRIEGKDDLLKA